MKKILLLRHAKSAWNDARLADHDRPLNRRGERAAKAMADHVLHSGYRPDLILCSTALRTRQTMAPLVKRFGLPGPSVALESDLYLASEGHLLERLREIPDEVGAVLLVGHNDGIWQLAEALVGSGPTEALASLHDKFPTGSLAVFHVPAGHWRDLAAGSGELLAFVRPRDLMRS
jgi:phosphohistidine phosphatase